MGLAVAVLWAWGLSLRAKARRLRLAEQQWVARYSYRAGYLRGFGNYRLVSLDGGQSWYEVDATAVFCPHLGGVTGFTNLRPARGDLLARLDACRRATALRLFAGRPLTPTNPEHRAALIAAGLYGGPK
jgi:hypothetical protein